MRDIALTIFVLGMLPMVLMQPHIGALLWAWFSFMIPHRLTWGFAFTFPFAYIIAVTTLIGLVLSRERTPFPRNLIVTLLIALVLWMSVTSLFAIGAGDAVYAAWLRMVKIHLMLIVTLMLIHTRARIDQLVWVIVLSIGFYGVKGGIYTLLGGGAGRVWGPPGGVIEGNNELALALVMIIPLMYYLMTTSTRNWVRFGLIFAMVTCSFSILGSHSRGAFLAIIAMVALLAMKSRYPLLLAVLGAAFLMAMFAFMPEQWTERMQTIENYQSDSSAMGRINTWHTFFNLAVDRPFVGGGFDIAIREVFQRYGVYPGQTVRAAHSVYLQALGEHGFVGLGLYLSLMVVTWFRARSLSRRTRGKPGLEWVGQLMRMTQVSLAGFAVGGAFLSLLHFDLPYYLMGLVVMVEAALKDESRSASSQLAGAKTPVPPPTQGGHPQATRTAIR